MPTGGLVTHNNHGGVTSAGLKTHFLETYFVHRIISTRVPFIFWQVDMRGTKSTGRGDAREQLVQSQEMLSEMVLPISPCPHYLSREQEITSRVTCVREWLTRDKDTALELQCNSRGPDCISQRQHLFPVWHSFALTCCR